MKNLINKDGNMKHILVFLCISLLLISTIVSIFMTVGADDEKQITDALGISGYCNMKTDANGKIHIVWHDNREGNYEIFYNTINEEHVINWDDDLQLTSRISDSKYPSLAIDNESNIHVVWQYDNDGFWDIYYKKLDNDGNSLTSDERVTDGGSSSERPTIIIDSEDNTHVVWYDDRDGTYEIYWNKRVEPDLTPVNMTLYPEKPEDGQSVDIEVEIQNLGNNDATDVVVDFLIDYILEDSQVITVDAQSYQTLQFSWPAVYGLHNFTILVDGENDIAEKREGNNNLTEIIAIYQESYAENFDIPADVTYRHFTDIVMSIDEETDPYPTGTPNSAGPYVDFTADNDFDWALITIGYNEAEVEGMGIVEESLLMYYWDIYNGSGEQWVLVGDCGVNVDQNYVWANVTHFSLFAPLGIVGFNQPPETPLTPDGRTGVYMGYEWSYSTSTVDPEDHQVFYQWDWGDEITSWLGPYTSGEVVTESHQWTLLGNYDVKVKAKDDPDGDGDPSDGLESSWSDILPVTVRKPGDTDGNGVVNVIDFLALLAAWGPCTDCHDCPADFNGDCTVSVLDFLILLANWG